MTLNNTILNGTSGANIINNSGKPEAASNQHDDLVMSLGIAWQLFQRGDAARAERRELTEWIISVVDRAAGTARWVAGDEVYGDATDEDWDTEYLALVLAVKVVDSIDEAIEHIGEHGSGHSEAIVTRDVAAARRFQLGVDAACVYVNASTRFTDGGEFGMGAEIGNSTQKLHARGPIGLRELCTFKYLVEGSGQIRP